MTFAHSRHTRRVLLPVTVVVVAVIVVAGNSGCSAPEDASSSHSASSSSSSSPEPSLESLPTVRLDPATRDRLGIQTGLVEGGARQRWRLVGGEVVVPPGQTVSVTAPVAGQVQMARAAGLAPGLAVARRETLLRLSPMAPADRDLLARAAREVTAAEANLQALELRVQRNEVLVAEQAGSRRALEEAIAARDVVRADLEIARSRASGLQEAPLVADVSLAVRSPSDGVVRALFVAEGQSIPAGAPLFDIVQVDALQVRVPVYGGDLGRLDLAASAHVHHAGDDAFVEVKPSAGPPTAEPDRGTVDRYFQLPGDQSFAPGERVLVELPFRQEVDAISVPVGAVVLDAWGGAWVYQCDNNYQRVRVNPIRRDGDRFILQHGPAVGSCIVAVGAVELFGTEFPPGH